MASGPPAVWPSSSPSFPLVPAMRRCCAAVVSCPVTFGCSRGASDLPGHGVSAARQAQAQRAKRCQPAHIQARTRASRSSGPVAARSRTSEGLAIDARDPSATTPRDPTRPRRAAPRRDTCRRCSRRLRRGSDPRRRQRLSVSRADDGGTETQPQEEDHSFEGDVAIDGVGHGAQCRVRRVAAGRPVLDELPCDHGSQKDDPGANGGRALSDAADVKGYGEASAARPRQRGHRSAAPSSGRPAS